MNVVAMDWRAILDLVFPAQCAACNALGSGLCAYCVSPAATPLNANIGELPIRALGTYDGALRAAVLSLKDGRRDVADALAERLAATLSSWRYASDCVLVPVPTTAARKRQRGMDGVAFIALRIAELTGTRAAVALSQRAGDAQRGRTRRERLAARGRFSCDGATLAGRRVLLIDDVCTTGATLKDCCDAVACAGGGVRGALVAALTKASGRDHRSYDAPDVPRSRHVGARV